MNVNDVVFRIENNLLVEENAFAGKYIIRKYKVDKLSNFYVWATCIDDRVRPDRQISRRYTIKEFTQYNIYKSYYDATGKIERLLKKEIIEAESTLERRKKELDLFYLENK